LTLGGVIPAAIGGTGAGICIGIARQGRFAAPVRMAMCILAVIGTWTAVWLLHVSQRPALPRASSVDDGGAPDLNRYALDRESGRRNLYERLMPHRHEVEQAARLFQKSKADGFAVDVYQQRLAESQREYGRIIDITAQMLEVERSIIEALMAEGDAKGWLDGGQPP